MDVYHTIVRPLVTEKSTHQSQRSSERHGGTYSFEVLVGANKAQIRDAVEKVYGVKVQSVRTCVKQGKARRFRFHVGGRELTKKAIVTLEPGSAISLF